uniref:DNA2/NAM7 helicase-like C-terminal domain-containing protein n=1 Tax=Fagus sylvatica TaxID=28930 RepID=A0A2N9F0I6_FAGSY
MKSRICSSDLNDSQKDAVLSCLITKKCNHQNTIKLIWGPSGTGKTKTVGLLLFSLLRMKCRTLTCAPTNTAVLEVAQRLLKNVTESLEYGTYGLGDLVLFGNGKRMKIVDRHDLLDVFLDNRVKILQKCLVSSSGWKGSLLSMICLLEDPKRQYDLYLNKRSTTDNEKERIRGMSENKGTNRNQRKEIDQSFDDNKSKKNLKKVIVQALNENKIKKTHKEICPYEKENHLTFEEFVQSRFNCISKRLKYCIENLYTHLPTSIISLEVVKNMNIALDFLRSLETLLCTLTDADKGLKQVFGEKEQSRLSHIMKSSFVREDCLRILNSLPQTFSVPDFTEEHNIKKFCLENSCLTFCTVSSSAKLHEVKAQWELLVIDEAAQLKECESTIPLQLPGLRHAILVGDETATSCDAHGREEFDNSHSLRNMIEVAVASEIVASLFKESVRTKKVKVGIISPYKAQVYAIEEKVKKYNADSNSDFSISVRSVDGFQGGEEDVIIMSTVRSNMNGVVGFLKNHQRTNVALTRARHCLWILGNEATLTKKFSIWKELVIDAKKRRCFYNADEDKGLAQAIKVALVEHNQIHTLLNMDSFLFRESRWKVSFSNDFLKSMSRVKNAVTCKEVLNLLENLANGWRQPHWKKNLFVHHGTSSQLLEQYKVNGFLNLVWTVDILKENSYYIQILKVWDILPLSKMPRLANHLDVLFGNYTVDKMNRCKHKCLNGCLVVPMRWPIDSNISPNVDPVLSLSELLASIGVRDDFESSSTTNINKSTMGRDCVTNWLGKFPDD